MFVLCSRSPFSTDVIKVNLSAPLPYLLQNTSSPSPVPWAVELSTGERCIAPVGGTRPSGAGLPVTFICGTEIAKLFDTSVVGDIDRSGSVWEASVQRAGEGVVRTISVAVAYG
jgi:hypothetical protein